MSEFKDSKIKLFGHTINLSHQFPSQDRIFDGAGVADDHQSSKSEEDHVHPPTSSDESKGSTSPPPKSDDTSNIEEEEEKTLKKPDKILPCPRCNSMDTKFCYFNNYNVNQPRHLCKNCQRYWTAGGTMRNVPIGAGRRKTKSSIIPIIPIMPSSLFNKSIHHTNTAELMIPNYHHHHLPQVPCLPYQWNWGSPVHFISPPAAAAAAHYWNCVSVSADSSKLGKHSREDDDDVNDDDENHSDHKCVLTPKTLRIDDPGEAAKSSIWATLGKKSVDHSCRGDSVVVGGGLFKAFQSQSKNLKHELERSSSSVLRANPAALSRSMSFQETS